MHIVPKPLSLTLKPPKKRRRLTQREVVLLTSESFITEKNKQDDQMMLYKLRRYVPLIYESDEMQYDLLTSASTASNLEFTIKE
ncbi:hypothetical protein INT45_007904 [Circinella minor]|uniref:Uncharacterized protein n=1 Tax=Circinella minor TaxID=1195481 RepID=A0A8H7S8F3_9FUNG|nr:hypothetical protein INT45_007904 [Circinella minor]